jgi:hypothetical protein
MERAPNRVVGAVFVQTVGHRPEDPTVMYRHSSDNWVPGFHQRQPNVSTDAIEKYLHDLYAAQSDFLHSVSRDFIRNCQTPMLVLPDDTDSHPLQTSIQVASLAPDAEITVFPWKEPPELKQHTVERVRKFLRDVFRPFNRGRLSILFCINPGQSLGVIQLPPTAPPGRATQGWYRAVQLQRCPPPRPVGCPASPDRHRGNPGAC